MGLVAGVYNDLYSRIDSNALGSKWIESMAAPLSITDIRAPRATMAAAGKTNKKLLACDSLAHSQARACVLLLHRRRTRSRPCHGR
jgi:hypothetical protein